MNQNSPEKLNYREKLWILRRPTQLLFDISVLITAFLLAYLLRFDFKIPPFFLETALDQLPFVVLVQFAAFFIVGGYSLIWRYISIEDIKFFLKAALYSAVVLIILRLALSPERFLRWQVPLSIISLDTIFAFGGIFASRMLRRWVYDVYERREHIKHRRFVKRKTALFVGAGQTGALTVKEILRREDVALDVKGFVDDDKRKKNGSVNGIKVLGSTEDLPRLVSEMNIDEVVLSLDESSSKNLRHILQICQEIGVKTQIIPNIHEIVDGRVQLERIRAVQIEDLLGREPVALDDDKIQTFLQGKVVMVTGAGGSIGSELVRQVANFQPETLLLVERAEFNLFEIDRELKQTFPNLKRIPLIADVCDEARMTEIFARFRPAVIFHAAAHKHVPLMEQNPVEAIKNNVFGTKSIAELAGKFDAEAFVLISTDKAVNPTSVMGASKRIAELVAQSANQRFSTNYIAVRFGNVLGSAGSVVPIFKEQIRKGEAVTVTHPEMTRYFMTIPEAASLVLQAGTIGKGGEIFILDMGEPVRIAQLAEDLIRLSGLTPYEDIDIVFTGIRAGEKLFEELEITGESLLKTHHPKIFIGKIQSYSNNQVEQMLNNFQGATESSDENEIRRLFNEILPEANITTTEKPAFKISNAQNESPKNMQKFA